MGRTLGLKKNLVGSFSSCALSHPRGCEIAFFGGNCAITEVIEQRYYLKIADTHFCPLWQAENRLSIKMKRAIIGSRARSHHAEFRLL
jgi:hypothetical protein